MNQIFQMRFENEAEQRSKIENLVSICLSVSRTYVQWNLITASKFDFR